MQIIAGSVVEIREIWLASECAMSIAEYNRNNSAIASIHKAKDTYLRDKLYRLKARRGYKRAAVAVAHRILVAIYHMFSPRVCYNELGDFFLDRLNIYHLTSGNLVHRLEHLAHTVPLEQKAASSPTRLPAELPQIASCTCPCPLYHNCTLGQIVARMASH